ncbi:MAG TPA: ParB/RepB/Spo0J family partition protein [Gammaproteobacteria bacterium]|nr:ParB/RepB/Spo0J family partition protein [Gammaproteobacteria bacterium]
MSIKKRGLGKGLNELLLAAMGPDSEAEVLERNAAKSDVSNKGGDRTLSFLKISEISGGPFQPRLTMDPQSIAELCESIKAQGVLQPIVVRKKGKAAYEIVAGERRWRAAQLAGLTEIPALIKDVSDTTALAIALIENIQRDNLNPIEEAKALKRLAEELGVTHQQLGEAVGKSRTNVSNLLRLLALNPEVQSFLEKGHLEMGHARALLSLPAPLQHQVAKSIVGRGLSVRETERLVMRLQDKKENARPLALDPNIRRLQNDLAEKLGAPVFIRHSAKKGQGQLVIRYNDLDELDGILAHFQ